MKEVGQKHINNLSSQFFREYNTQQFEQSLSTFEELKSFTDKSTILSVNLTYPTAYQEDYNKSLDYYLAKNYTDASDLVNQGKYDLALTSITKVKKYNTNYKNITELQTTSNCEPLYIQAIRNMENKNYKSAQTYLSNISAMATNYKDVKELQALTADLLKRTFIIFEPKNSPEKDIEDKLYNSFIELSYQKSGIVKLINNTPFLYMPNVGDANSVGNVDLLQAIKKATNADFFYVFDIANKKEEEPALTRGNGTCYEKVITKKDTIFITEYKSYTYSQVKGSRTYKYDFKYKVIDANTNQIITSQSQECNGTDEINYYELVTSGRNVSNTNNAISRVNINNCFPYNPATTPAANQYNPASWRAGFSNRKELKSFIDLKTETDNKALNIFSNTLNTYIIK